MRLSTFLIGLGLLGCGKVNEVAAVDDAGTGGSSTGGTQSTGGTHATGGSAGSSGGSAGGAGIGGSGGVGGAAGSGGSSGLDLTHYHACELPTGAIRYGIFKADPFRDLCFNVVVGGADPKYGGITVTSPIGLAVESVHVWQGAAKCGDWPSPSGAVAADSGSGTIEMLAPQPYLTTVDVTLAFTPSASWVPASETIHPPDPIIAAFDCDSCDVKVDAYAKLIQQSVKPGGGPNACTSIVRLDHTTKKPKSHAVVCDVYDQTTEAEARASLEAAIPMAPGSAMLSSPANDQYVFRGLANTGIPEADRVAGSVSRLTGLVTFGATIAWFGQGSVKVPANFNPGYELGGGCPAIQKPTARGFTLIENPKKLELDPPVIAEVMDAVWSTAVPRGILKAWGNHAFDAVILEYPTSLTLDPNTAEYVVLINHGWLE